MADRPLRRLSKLLKLHLFALYADVKELAAGRTSRLLDACPVFEPATKFKTFFKRFSCTVGLIGLEPMTLRLSSACSNQLSYRPMGLG